MSFYATFKLVDSLSWGSGPPIRTSVTCPSSLHAGCTLLFKIRCELVTLTRDHIDAEQIWEVTNQNQMQGFGVPFYFLFHGATFQSRCMVCKARFIKKRLKLLYKVSRSSKWKEKHLFKGHYSGYNKIRFFWPQRVLDMYHEEIIKIVKLASKIVIWLAAKLSAYRKGILRYWLVSACQPSQCAWEGRIIEKRLSETNTEGLIKLTETITVINSSHNLYHLILSWWGL